MMSGTFVITDTINGAFNSIFGQTYKNADAVITGKTAFTNLNGNGVQAPSFPESLLGQVKALPDVNAAAGSVSDDKAKLVGRNGKTITRGGAPSLASSVDPNDHTFNALQLVSGSWPRGNEIAIDSGTAGREHYKPGDTIGVESRGPVRPFRIAGVVKLPGVSLGGATLAIFDLPTAQEILRRKGKLDAIRVQSKAGVSSAQLVSEIKPLLPPTAQLRPTPP